MRDASNAKEAFEAFMIETQPRFARVAYLLTGDPHEADDLLQSSYLAVYANWGRLWRGDGNPAGYLHVTINNTFLNSRKVGFGRYERVAERLPDVETEAVDLERVLDRDEAMRRLNLLDPRERVVIVARYYFDRSVAEVAHDLGCSPTTVKNATRSGVMKMRTAAASGRREER